MKRKRARRGKPEPAPSWRIPALPISRQAAAGAGSALVAFVIIALATPVAWTWIKSHSYFAVTAVDVEGNLRTFDQEIIELAAVRPGQSLWDLSPSVLTRRVEEHPWVQKSKVRLEASGRVVIEVHERKPIAIVRFKELHYVDRRGHVLGPLAADDSRDFPMITGLEEGAQRAFAPVALPRTAQLLRWCERRDMIDDVSEVFVDREAGVTMYPSDVNVAVELGWGRWREKLNRSARVFAAWQGRLERLATIDVTFPEKVIVRMRDGQPATEGSAKAGRRI